MNTERRFIRKEPVLSLNYDAFPYQEEAFEAVKDLEYAGIFHEQGLGKTKIAVDLICYWLAQKRIDSVLVVTKKTLISNWQKEIKMHTQIEPEIFTSNHRKNYHRFNSVAYLYLAHYQVLLSDQKSFERFFRSRRVAVILDESAAIKNAKAKISKCFHQLSKFIPVRVIMSGTPYANKPEDIWSQIYFLDGGESLGKNSRIFKERYEFPREPYRANRFANNLSRLKSMISDFTVRETKESAGIELPNKNYKTVWADFSPVQHDIYSQAKEEMYLDVIKDGKISHEDLEWILIRMNRLIQITSNPGLINDEYSEIPGKMQLLKDTLSQISGNDQGKAIIWTHFIENTKLFRTELADYCPAIIHGSQSDDENNAAIDSFNNDDQTKILIATPQKAGEGLTLTVANHAIFYDRSFSLQHYLQAQDRIHRISQRRSCQIYNLYIENSIDEYIDKLVRAKHISSQLASGDISKSEFIEEGRFDLAKTLQEILS